MVGPESPPGSGTATPSSDATLHHGDRSASESSFDTIVGTDIKKVAKAIRQSDNFIARPVDGSAKKEHSEQGKVKRGVYRAYINSVSVPAIAIMLACILAQQAMTILGNWTLKNWADENEGEDTNSRVSGYLVQYGSLSLASGLFSIISGSFLWFVRMIDRSLRLD